MSAWVLALVADLQELVEVWKKASIHHAVNVRKGRGDTVAQAMQSADAKVYAEALRDVISKHVREPHTDDPPTLHAFDQADVALGCAGLWEGNIFRTELRAARAAVAELIEADVEYDKAAHAFNAARANPPKRVELRYARAIARRDAALAAVTKEQRHG